MAGAAGADESTWLMGPAVRVPAAGASAALGRLRTRRSHASVPWSSHCAPFILLRHGPSLSGSPPCMSAAEHEDQVKAQSTASSVYAAVARTATRSVALYFSRPVRLFRPSKGAQIHQSCVARRRLNDTQSLVGKPSRILRLITVTLCRRHTSHGLSSSTG